MERSTIHLLAKRGKSIRQIAAELGRSPTTIARTLQEPVDRPPAKRYRRSKVDPYRPQIEQWVREGLTAERMLELARADPARPLCWLLCPSDPTSWDSRRHSAVPWTRMSTVASTGPAGPVNDHEYLPGA